MEAPRCIGDFVYRRNNHENDLYKIKSRDSIDDDATRKPHYIITGNCERVLDTQRKHPTLILSNDEDGFRKPHFIITGNCERVLETQREQPKII